MPNLPPFFITEPIYRVRERKKFPLAIILPTLLSSQEEAFLAKIVQSIDLSLEKCQIIDNASDIEAKIDASKVISFGVPLAQMLAMPAIIPYQLISQQDIHWIQADSLAKIEVNTELKRELWKALQTLKLK